MNGNNQNDTKNSQNIGIDSIAFSTSRYFLPLKVLAEHRNVDYRKYYEGIGQKEMAIFPPNEDIVTIAIDAAERALSMDFNRKDIFLLIFATESSFDLSKSAGIFVHHFLGLRSDCRVFDVKQACYSATAALQMAKTFVACDPGTKALVIGSDIVKYSPNTSGEPTQGGAAVAMVISENPRIMRLEPYSGVYTDDVADFWRPSTADEAQFDGRLSAHNYLKSLGIALDAYLKRSKLSKSDIDHVCFHSPFNKMAIKAARQSFSNYDVQSSLIYNALIGNSCSASLYISLISLLDNCAEDLSDKRIGMFSYGSGSVAEFFSGIVADGYKKALFTDVHKKILANRTEISFDEYEKMVERNKASYTNIGKVTLAEIVNGYRKYKAIE